MSKNKLISDFLIELFELEYKNVDNNIFNYKLNILNIIYMINNESN